MAEPTRPTPGTFCWNELLTGDVSSAAAFYTRLFGWTTRTMPAGTPREYTLFISGERELGGMMQPPAEGQGPQWLSYVAVESVDRTLEAARGLGAQIHKPATDIPGIGRFAVLQDPTGAVFAVFQAA